MNKRVLEILEWPLIEEKLLSLCYSEPAQKMVKRLKPVSEDKIKIQMSKITALKELRQRGEAADLSGLNDISEYTAIASRGGVLDTGELLLVRKFTTASERIKIFLKERVEEFPPLNDELSRINPLPDLKKTLTDAITDEGELNPDKFPQLRKIRRNIASARQDIEKRISKIIHSPDSEKMLQEKTFTTVNGRYVILVKTGMKGRVNGNVHDISASGATVFMEPSDITPLNNNIIILEKELQMEIQKILAELSGKVSDYASELTSNQRVLTYFDFINAAARFSIMTGSSEPQLSEKAEMKLVSAKHPLLYIMSPETVVANDVELGSTFNCLIISGANTGGKTVMLKTIGLCAVFAMLGLHIPASPDSVIGIFSNVMADIGDDQNLSSSLSTFSGQLTIINEILRRADSRSLVIIDEIIVGTNPAQGAALSQAILEEMINTGSRIVVTTHYTELKELAVKDPRFSNASVTFNLETLRPAYRLKIGIPGISYAVEIARNYGISENILTRSKELIDSREASVESLLEKVQLYEDEIREEREKVKILTEEIAEEKKKIEEQQRKLNRLIEEARKKEGIDFIDELKTYREKIAERITMLQELDQKEAGKLNLEIQELQNRIADQMKNETRDKHSSQFRELVPSEAEPGDRVFISTIETEGILEEIDSSGETARVLLGGSIRSRFPVKNLFFVSPGREGKQHSAVKRPVIKTTGGGPIPSTMQTSYNTVDLRGKRVDEALSFMSLELDRMDRSSIKTVIIIHGHGTGAMKQAVREALKMNIYVRDFRPGEYGEGGDGVTVAALRD